MAAEAVAPPAGRGKAYFIERFLKDVLLAESGLAGVNRRVEMQKAAAQLGAYAAMALAAVIGSLVLWYSYGTNRTYLTEFAAYTAGPRTATRRRIGRGRAASPRRGCRGGDSRAILPGRHLLGEAAGGDSTRDPGSNRPPTTCIAMN